MREEEVDSDAGAGQVAVAEKTTAHRRCATGRRDVVTAVVHTGERDHTMPSDRGNSTNRSNKDPA